MPRILPCAYDVHILDALNFEWDEAKRRENLAKHRIEFADAVTAFSDENAITLPDETSDEEDRFVTMAIDALGRILVIVYTWRGNTIRLISARRATPRERKNY